jgi:hypothetical protein
VLALSATWLAGQGGLEFSAEGETVSVPRPSVDAFRVKRFSTGKTAIFAGALIAGALIIQGVFEPIGGGSSGDGSGGPIR